MHTSIPVILVRGFLEAGKTTFINSMLQDRRFMEQSILVISCEEGELPYSSEIPTAVFVCLEDESSLNETYLTDLAALHTPDLIIIECNAMWKMIEFELPGNWKITQRITILSASTLRLYLDNMRSIMGPMLSRCDQIIINRCSAPEFADLSPVKSSLRPLLDDTSVVQLESDGLFYNFDTVKDLLPYPLDEDLITISPEHYGYWFYDCQDHPDRYQDRRITLQASIKKSPVLPAGDFAVGRLAMTCCEADMSFLGYIAHFDQIDQFDQFAFVSIDAVVDYQFMKQYQKIMPYLQILHMEPSVSEENIVTF